MKGFNESVNLPHEIKRFTTKKTFIENVLREGFITSSAKYIIDKFVFVTMAMVF